MSTSSSSVVASPATLLAEVPGILGFYPTDSAVIISFTAAPGSTRHSLGPVIRLDLDNREGMTQVRETLANLTPSLLLAVVVSADQPMSIDLLDDLDLDVIWHTAEVTTGTPYTLLRSARPLHEMPEGWLSGEIGPVHQATSMRQLLDSGRTLDLSRAEASDRFTYDPRELDDDTTYHVSLLADALLSTLMLAHDEGTASFEAAEREVLTQLEAALTEADPARVHEDAATLSLLSACMSDLPDVRLRDATFAVCLKHTAAAREALRLVARTSNDDLTVANSWAAYVIISARSGILVDCPLALHAGLERQPDHRLSCLLLTGLNEGQGKSLADAVERGAIESAISLGFDIANSD